MNGALGLEPEVLVLKPDALRLELGMLVPEPEVLGLELEVLVPEHEVLGPEPKALVKIYCTRAAECSSTGLKRMPITISCVPVL